MLKMKFVFILCYRIGAGGSDEGSTRWEDRGRVGAQSCETILDICSLYQIRIGVHNHVKQLDTRSDGTNTKTLIGVKQ